MYGCNYFLSPFVPPCPGTCTYHEGVPACPRLDVPDPDGGVEGAGDDVDAVELQRVDAVRVA